MRIGKGTFRERERHLMPIFGGAIGHWLARYRKGRKFIRERNILT